MKNCPECGKPIGYGSTDCCKNCGADLREYKLSPPTENNSKPSRHQPRCPECGKPIVHGTTDYCKNCGADLSEYNIPRSVPNRSQANSNDNISSKTSENYSSYGTNNSQKETLSDTKKEISYELGATTMWISSLKTIFKVIFWLLLIATVILGIYLVQENVAIGLVVFIFGLVFDFMNVGFQLVFLDLAEDIRAIKLMLSKMGK